MSARLTWRNGGWLQEAWQNRGPATQGRGRSDFRKCMMLPGLPLEVERALKARGFDPKAPGFPAPRPPSPARVDLSRADRRTPPSLRRTPRGAPAAQGAPPVPGRTPSDVNEPRAGAEGHVALGALLFALPPAGLLALWSSARYPREGKIAVTVVTGLWVVLVMAAVIAWLAS